MSIALLLYASKKTLQRYSVWPGFCTAFFRPLQVSCTCRLRCSAKLEPKTIRSLGHSRGISHWSLADNLQYTLSAMFGLATQQEPRTQACSLRGVSLRRGDINIMGVTWFNTVDRKVLRCFLRVFMWLTYLQTHTILCPHKTFSNRGETSTQAHRRHTQTSSHGCACPYCHGYHMLFARMTCLADKSSRLR